MSTITTWQFPYCTPILFLERYDVRTVGDYLSDTDSRLAPIDVQNSQILKDLLMQASGIVESYALLGGHYTQADLQLIAHMAIDGSPIAPTNNAAQMLYGIVAGICMFLIWERRPLRYSDYPLPQSSQFAMDMMEKISQGAMIFGILEVSTNAIPEMQFVTNQEIRERNWSSNQARRFFGNRAPNNVPGW